MPHSTKHGKYVLLHNNNPFQTKDFSDLKFVADIFPDSSVRTEDILDDIYLLTQNDAPEEIKAEKAPHYSIFKIDRPRSTSVGDVIYSSDDQIFEIVDSVGFRSVARGSSLEAKILLRVGGLLS